MDQLYYPKRGWWIKWVIAAMIFGIAAYILVRINNNSWVVS